MGSLTKEQMAKLSGENRELASQMPDTAWQKHLANLSPEKLQEAKDAVALHKAQTEARKAGLLEGVEGEGEEEEEDAWEAWFDWLLVRVGLGALALIVGALAVGWAVQDGN